jgi:putative transposase
VAVVCWAGHNQAGAEPTMPSVPVRGYPTARTAEQGALVAPDRSPKRGRGRPPPLDVRAVRNALRDFPRPGCQWRLLPRADPPSESGRYYLDTGTRAGTRERVQRARVRHARAPAGRPAPPTAGILDRQRVKRTAAGGERGGDGGNKRPGAQAASGGGPRRLLAGGGGPCRGRE